MWGRNVVKVSLEWFLCVPCKYLCSSFPDFTESILCSSRIPRSHLAPLERNSLPRIHFPSLVHLSLYNVDLHQPPDIFYLLSPTALPSLRALGSHPLSWGSPSEVPHLPIALACLAPQLTAISLSIFGFLTPSHMRLGSLIAGPTLLETIREKTLFDLRSTACTGNTAAAPSDLERRHRRSSTSGSSIWTSRSRNWPT